MWSLAGLPHAVYRNHGTAVDYTSSNQSRWRHPTNMVHQLNPCCLGRYTPESRQTHVYTREQADIFAPASRRNSGWEQKANPDDSMKRLLFRALPPSRKTKSKGSTGIFRGADSRPQKTLPDRRRHRVYRQGYVSGSMVHSARQGPLTTKGEKSTSGNASGPLRLLPRPLR